jgi:AraC family transcriptional regulator
MRTTAPEAFTRAFRAISASRRSGPRRNVLVVSSFRSQSSWTQPARQPQGPAFRNRQGAARRRYRRRYNCEGSAAIPGKWQRFHQSVDNIPARIGKVAFGVCCNGDDSGNFDYIAGVEVADFSDLPREFARVRIPEQKYAVFTHAEHISTIRRTVNTIWNHWLPISGMKAADAPNFERYDENFDPATGNGGLEIWYR